MWGAVGTVGAAAQNGRVKRQDIGSRAAYGSVFGKHLFGLFTSLKFFR